MKTPERRMIDSDQYGNFIKVEENEIQKAKKIMLENLIDTIRELAKREDFFIVKHPDDFNNDPVSKDLKQKPFLEKGQITVGWKICIPSLKKETEK